ncbi:MAG: (E)-4-hydroxy-3-methylbut-2-enyl-diphosphate synthase [bacterium]|nr:(E)-4-hydroxy-3-methylbut-2-enyl-diphosphate synthase [bacterium]
MPDNKYSPSLFSYKRRTARVVDIGGIPCGGDNPIRIQSMTTTDTMDTEATAAESIRMIESGCEYVRITAPSIREAENLKNIKDVLRNKGYNTPIIADIHYTPNAAETAARIVEKVRINPGNYVDRKRFKTIDYTDESYNSELDRIHERFSPLVKICREHGTAMRIGTNHGSLSDRIMSRYGDTPLGMAESAMEFIRICEDNDYRDIVLSMKSSNTIVMVQAYRLLVNRMDAEGMDYPLHLGVTEAGEGEEGRIKSAVGIGALLEDGLGDTVRVSLTEPPEYEAPVVKTILKRYEGREGSAESPDIVSDVVNPFEYRKRVTRETGNIGSDNVPRVIADLSSSGIDHETLAPIGYEYISEQDRWKIGDLAADYIYAGDCSIEIELPSQPGVIYNYNIWKDLEDRNGSFPLYNLKEFTEADLRSDKLNFICVGINDIDPEDIPEIKNTVLIVSPDSEKNFKDIRKLLYILTEFKIGVPVCLIKNYHIDDKEDFLINSAIDIGGLLIDGFVDGVWLTPVSEMTNRTVFNILQAARARISKTEYISCPSCGRTLFHLQETSAKIRERTDHLKGVKIGIMGCIVNGPGEMADADFGYVGTGPGKISLYRKQEVVKKNIPESQAVDLLIDLIKEEGRWIEPS